MTNTETIEAPVTKAVLPGAVGIILDAEEVWFLHACGLADAVTGILMQQNTLYQIAPTRKSLVQSG